MTDPAPLTDEDENDDIRWGWWLLVFVACAAFYGILGWSLMRWLG